MKNLLNIKYLIVLASIFGVFGLASPASALTDTDDDSIADVVEDEASLNSGDNNYDEVQDSDQNTVATIENPNDIELPDAPVTLQLGETYTYTYGDYEYSYTTSDWKIDEFKAVDPATLPSQPEGKVFPLGMFSIKLSCYSESECYEYDEGCYSDEIRTQEINSCVVQIPANLKLIFDRVLDTTNWTTFKYDPTTDTYIDYSPYITISNQEIGFLRTVVEWSIYDGGFGDEDGVENGYISDPIGPAVPIAQVTNEVKPTIAEPVAGPALANTGTSTQFILAIGASLFVAGFALMPKKVKA